MKRGNRMWHCVFDGGIAAAALTGLAAPGFAGTGGADPFELGQIIVNAPLAPEDRIAIGTSSLSAEAIYLFNRNTLDDAVNLMPGVSSGNSGGSRNERLVFVRGFDRLQVPLSIDGIRVYLPADNRLDFGRFLTPDIAEVQVAKGYASVLDGPGAMGGAVNLVTRKPARSLEIEARGTLNLDRDADYGGYTVFGLVGTRQDRWYAQASFARTFRDHWDLAGGYDPVPGSAEDGGARDFSRTNDWRVNVKLGFTPNATDEYAISYTRQEGSKNAPLHVTDDFVPPIAPGTPTARYWRWPFWNIENIYFLSTTALGDTATLKTRIYRNTFSNLLRSFDDRTQTTQNSPMPRVFNSPYRDSAWGGSTQLDIDLAPANRTSIALHYRRDKHDEAHQTFPTGVPGGFTEPEQENLEDTFSIAAENALSLAPGLIMTTGASYDWRDIKRAEEYGTPPGETDNRIFGYPLRNTGALNWQARLEYNPEVEIRYYASVSRRSRFPTIFERFSTQFGTAASNPGLRPERATNYEIGLGHSFGPVQVEAAAYYSRIDHAIVSVRPAGSSLTTTRRENLGDGEYYGGEIALVARLSATLLVGANYSYIRRTFDIRPQPGSILPAAFALTDVPSHKGFAYLNWSPAQALSIVPSIDIASDRTTLASTVPTPPGIPVYYRTGGHALANLRIDFDVTDAVTIGVGARNLFDDTYQLVDGFPEEGRSFFASARARM